MRKSHRQKVAYRKAKRRAAGAEKRKLNDFLSRANLCVKGRPRKSKLRCARKEVDCGLINILRDSSKFNMRHSHFKFYEIPSPQWAIDGHAFIRENARTIFDGFFEEKSRAYAKDAAEKALIGPIISAVHEPEVVGVDPAANAAGKTFIDALISAVAADNPERFLSSFESLNPGLLERVCPECDGTGWSYHEHLPIERNVGCEDCGGCGDERGTGVTP